MSCIDNLRAAVNVLRDRQSMCCTLAGYFMLAGWSLLLFMLPAAPVQAGHPPEQRPAYRFGVFPYLSAERMEYIYAPLAAELGKALGRPVKFRTASRFKRFFKRLAEQHYDIALIQPFWYPPAVDRFGYQPLVRMAEPFTSLVMVLEDSPIESVADLRGKVIATPPAFVPVVHMARRALRKAGIDPDRAVQLKAFRSVDSCFQQVLIGEADACITPPFAVAVIEEKMKVRLRAVLETPALPNLSVVVHSRVPQEDRQRLKSAFLSLDRTNSGRILLERMHTGEFVTAEDSEYDVVRTFLKEIGQHPP